MTTQTRTPEKAQATATEKDMFLMGAEREFQTTLNVLQAYPSTKLDLKPHEKSQTARDLMWVLVAGKLATDKIIAGKLALDPIPPAPKTREELIAAFKRAHKGQIEKVGQLSQQEFNALIKVQAGPRDFMEVRRADALWFLAMDGIHHRGQLSVYLRMAGGKVPSIYGPSGDEPWV
jgi:uncharacterized damage-inducible protein DinB